MLSFSADWANGFGVRIRQTNILLKNILTIIAFCCCCLCRAQGSDSLLLANFKVLDAFHETFLADARVAVMEADSCTVLLDSMAVGDGFYAKVPRRDAYVLKIKCAQYPLTYQSIKIPQKAKGKYSIGKPVYIFREMERELGEAAVTASRILMVVKGDTLEYNASAFRMAEGSMLDNLIRALPGVKLSDDGRITVNGEYVSSLLVNGRDFFNGDPRVALSNLPAYTVSKIRTYHKSEKAELMGKTELTEDEKRESPLVMDVSLKREYAKGWISNYEMGGGMGIAGDSRMNWLGRLFAMRYTNHSSLAFFAGTNNLNDAMGVSDKGEWRKVDATEGEKKTHIAGLNFTLNPKDSPLKLSTALRAKRQNHIGDLRESGEDHYANLATMRKIHAESRASHTDLQWNANVGWARSRYYLRFEPSVSYSHHGNGVNTSSSMLQSAGNVGVDTLYRRNLYEQSGKRLWNAGATLLGMLFLPRNQMLDMTQKVTYNSRREHQYVDDALSYIESAQDCHREYRHKASPLAGYAYSGSLLYQNYEAVKTQNGKLRLFFKYQYEQDYGSARQELLRATDDGLAPSASQARAWITDAQNSYRTVRLNRTHTFDPYFDFAWGGFSVSAHAAMYAHKRHAEYAGTGHSEEIGIAEFAFAPSFSLGWSNKTHAIALGGSTRKELPEVLYLLDVQDSADPLTVLRGNPGLHPTRCQSAFLTYKASMKQHARQISLRAEFNRWMGKVAMAQRYDSQTGTTTFFPMNVDGNRVLDAKANYSASVGKRGNWAFSNELDFCLARSVDFSSASRGQELVLHAVRNAIVREDFRIDYRIGSMRVGGKATLAWTGQKSEQRMYRRQKFGTQGYGIVLSAPLLWGIDLDTDLMAYGRFGFSDATMNTTDWVWNVALTRGFGKGRQWMAKAIGFDVLRQLSNIRREVNAQGYVERRYNTMPSYVLFSLTYRLDIKPR